MKTTLTFLIFILSFPVFGVTTFTEFYCLSGGSNTYAGSTTSTTPAKYLFNGNWTNSTATFFLSGADLSAVSVGMWASVITNSNTRTYFVGRITAVDDTADTITVSTVAKSGTNPSDGVGNRDLIVGGAWNGPNGAEGFPLGFADGTMTNSSGNSPRINIKNNKIYSITSGITMAFPFNSGVLRIQGYTSTPGDLAFAAGQNFPMIEGGGGSAYNMLTLNCKNADFWNLQWASNGTASGSSDGIVTSLGTENSIIQCAIHDIRGNGLNFSTVNHIYSSEAYRCNLSNTSGKSGIALTASGILSMNCISHDNTTANSSGFQLDGGVNCIGNIAISNGNSGFRLTADVSQTLYSCASYGNGGAGFDFGGSLGPVSDPMVLNMMNTFAGGNTGAGISMSGANAQYVNGHIEGVAFGTGASTNAGGNFKNGLGAITSDGSNFQGIEVVNVQTLASGVTPWNSPTTGDFTITLAAAKSASTNYYTQIMTNRTWAGTIGYADFGAAQHRDAGGTSSGTTAYGFTQ